MNDKEYNQQVARLQKLADKWLLPLGLLWWKVTFSYVRDSDLPTRGDSNKFSCIANTSVAWEYCDANLTFSIKEVLDKKDDELEEIFVHECCHILINEMRQWADDEIPVAKCDEAMKHEERVVTNLAKAFLWTREAGEGKLSERRKKHLVARKKAQKRK